MLCPSAFAWYRDDLHRLQTQSAGTVMLCFRPTLWVPTAALHRRLRVLPCPASLSTRLSCTFIPFLQAHVTVNRGYSASCLLHLGSGYLPYQVWTATQQRNKIIHGVGLTVVYLIPRLRHHVRMFSACRCLLRFQAVRNHLTDWDSRTKKLSSIFVK